MEEEEEEEEADVDVEDDASSFDNSNEKITEMLGPDVRTSQYESPRTRRPFSIDGEDEDDLGDEDDDDDDEAPLVEITSRDPRAAARAAAILKMVCLS